VGDHLVEDVQGPAAVVQACAVEVFVAAQVLVGIELAAVIERENHSDYCKSMCMK